MSRIRVLIVDDDQLVLNMYRRTLSLQGHETQCASGSQEALDLLKEHEFDVVLSDISMPDMDGIELLSQIRKDNPDLPVVLVTGVPSLATAQHAVNLGAFRYMTKPVEPGMLKKVVAYAAKLHNLARLKREALGVLGIKGMFDSEDQMARKATFLKGMEQMWMAFQPVVSWPDQRVFGYEAFLRTHEPGIANPAEFFDLADEFEQVQSLGRKIRRSVAETITLAPTEVKLFVNIHPAELMDLELSSPDAPLSMVADRVILEITDRAALDQYGDVQDRIWKVKDLGFQVAVDDLGVGHAGLSSLASLEPSVAKIDMSLIRDIDSNPTKATLVRSLIQGCRDLDMTVVAEGVETVAEHEVLVEIGCDLFQGYLFGEPGETFCDPDLSEFS